MSGTAQATRSWSFAVVAAAVLSACVGAADAVPSAKDILDAAGVKGGLVVHLGCGDPSTGSGQAGKLTAALRANDNYLVHGLDADAGNVAKARENIRKMGLAGKVTVERHAGADLPYTDNLVNLLVAEDLGKVSMDEVLRVLAPDGVAYVKAGGAWKKTVKPRPKDIDEWTHYLHDAGGNAVARDTVVGPPRHMQWLAAPTWTRNHHTLASISAVVSTRRRVFYIMDEGSAASMLIPGKWFLVARDAFNGVLLWRRTMPSWAYHRKGFRSGPVQLPRTLVAWGDRVYAPPAMSAPVAALDAATGEIVRTYQETKGAEELIFTGGVLLVVTGSPMAEQASIDPALRGRARYPNDKSIVAVQADTGKLLWRWSDQPTARFMPMALAAAGKRVFFQAGKGILCLDRDTGKELWNSGLATDKGSKDPKGAKSGGQPQKKKRKRRPSGGRRGPGMSVATLVIHDGVVLWAGGGRLTALSAEDGKHLWNCPARAGFRSPTDVFVIGGLVWLGPGFAQGRDLRTGAVKKTNAVLAKLRTAGHHHRCYRQKATDRYIMEGHRGIEFLDLIGENHSRNNWIRGVCQYGIMPCNGLVYAPSHACGCYMEGKLYGFWAVAPERKSNPEPLKPRQRLEKGPAYGKTSNPKSEIRNPKSGDWPTLRGNPLRSGSTAMKVPPKLADVWQANVGGRISAPVVAGGKVFVAAVEKHTVHAFDAQSGKALWRYTAGGRVDSPPTIHNGLALFGSADGWVYCLRAADGELVWRFCAAPADRKTVALDQVESIWPVHGNVLVEGGVAYAVAGRYSYLDGGMVLYGLDPATGKVLHRTPVRDRHPKSLEGVTDEPRKKIVQNATDSKTFKAPDRSDAFSMSASRSDVLVSDGEAVFLRHLKFDAKLMPQEKSRHLLSTSRLLDDAEVHRSHWVLGTGDFSRAPVAYSWIAFKPNNFGWRLSVPYGLILTFENKTIWGVRRTNNYQYRLFANPNTPLPGREKFLPDFRRSSRKNAPRFTWMVDLPMRPRAMIRAGHVLLLGGMPMTIDPDDPHAAYEGRKGGLLWTMSTADGTKTAERKLPSPPVWDGLAAANGRLYLTTMDGRVMCLGGVSRR